MSNESRKTSDHYTKNARKEGYPARSVYKLQEIDRKERLFSRDQRVLDIGAAPGSWSRYALKRVGINGLVCAADLKPMEISASNLVSITGDIFSDDIRKVLEGYAPFDVVISDAAPSTTGNRLVDTSRSTLIVEEALKLATLLLKQGGSAIIKIFQGGDEKTIMDDIRHEFKKCRFFRPRAVRSESFETYLICIGKYY